MATPITSLHKRLYKPVISPFSNRRYNINIYVRIVLCTLMFILNNTTIYAKFVYAFCPFMYFHVSSVIVYILMIRV